MYVYKLVQFSLRSTDPKFISGWKYFFLSGKFIYLYLGRF